MIDFTNCRIIPGRAYNGANGSKIAIEYNGEIYMLKFPPSGKKKPTELSYTNSCISEYIASNIFNMLGIRAQETLIGTYIVKGKTKIVCACKDFTASGKRLFDFCSMKNTIIDSESNGSGTELEDIMETIDRQQYIPQADDRVMQKVLANDAELHARIYQFPTSAIKLNGRKINYYDFLTKVQNKDCNEALKRIVLRINMEEIGKLIDEIPYISDLQKEFYKKYLGARYKLIICPAYELVMVREQEETR